MALPRLRQVAFVARRIDPVADALRTLLALPEPYRDPAVGHFGLENVVFPVGDTFLEVVRPVRGGTAAGRHLERQDSDAAGYMAMLQVPDEAATRARLRRLGVRVVWDFSEPDITDLHLHPRDVPGTLVALDVCDPPGSWRWGGPAWTARVPAVEAGGLRGLTVAVPAPEEAARRWAEVLGTVAERRCVPLAGGQQVRFVAATTRPGIVGLVVEAPDRPEAAVDLAGVRIELVRTAPTASSATLLRED